MSDKADIYAGLHDAELLSVAHEKKENKVSLFLMRPDGSNVNLILRGVKVIRMNDFISQNVVSRVLHSGSMNISQTVLKDMVTWANSLSDGTCLISQNSIIDYVSEIQNGNMRIFSIEPSWGAELICIYTADET